ncbi:MAG: thiamine pyrophosphate-dependent dehydrogenase E1 component subunit alpha [Pseudomonadota bacterium]
MTLELNTCLYEKVFFIRKVEELIQAYYLEDEMETPMHMSMGGEAISAGACQALESHDQLLGTYRSHGIYLARTMEAEKFFGELYGKTNGPSRGKAGSMHLMAIEQGLICTSAIVASNIPVAAGAAFALKKSGVNGVAAVFFGDGAIDEGAFWETLNTACLMKLPVMFVCEDNGYAVHNPAQARHGYDSIAEVAKGFKCDVYQSNSTDPEVIYTLIRSARVKTLESGRPAFLNLKYYRYLEHVGVFPDFKAGYRSEDEYRTWLDRDPVALQRRKLVLMTSEENVAGIEAALSQKAMAGLASARVAPFPELKEICEGLIV